MEEKKLFILLGLSAVVVVWFCISESTRTSITPLIHPKPLSAFVRGRIASNNPVNVSMCDGNFKFNHFEWTLQQTKPFITVREQREESCIQEYKESESSKFSSFLFSNKNAYDGLSLSSNYRE